MINLKKDIDLNERYQNQTDVGIWMKNITNHTNLILNKFHFGHFLQKPIVIPNFPLFVYIIVK